MLLKLVLEIESLKLYANTIKLFANTLTNRTVKYFAPAKQNMLVVPN